MDLQDRTTVIIHRVKNVKLNIWDLGNDLLYIQQHELYKEDNFNSMEDYIEYYKDKDKFGFGYRQAQKYIAIAKELPRDALGSSHSLSEIYLLTSIPTEYRDEIVEKIKEKTCQQKNLLRLLNDTVARQVQSQLIQQIQMNTRPN